MTIKQFRGEHFYLSNMYALVVPIEAEGGILVPTSEHAYQAAKFVDPKIRREVAATKTGIDAKNKAHALEKGGAPTRPDWYDVNLGIMHAIVRQKFLRNPGIAAKLIGTGSQELVEGNDWGDRFWGVDPVGSKNGLNHLGRILMSVRDEIRSA